MKMKTIALMALGVLSLAPVRADEGMWLLPFLKEQNSEQLKELGLTMDVEDLYNPDGTSMHNAVVIFGGGCTGEIISPEGLLLTNHHCGYGTIQSHSTVEHDYLQDGFWAMTREEEIPSPGLKVQFIDRIEEVTDFVLAELADSAVVDPMVMYDPAVLNKLAEDKLGEEYLADHPWVVAEIKPFYGGNRYFLFEKKVYTDIRMVGAPPSSIGKFGADTDNWMWPRHTGDFSLFRVYMDKDGNPADYDESNVPLQPKRYFNISLKEIQENDFAMVMGFPGTTNRYYTSHEVKQRRDITNEIMVKMRGIRQDVMLEEMLADPAVRIQYANKYAGSTNYWKNAIGMSRGINNLDVIGKKMADEAAFEAWATENDKPEYVEALASYADAISKLDSIKYQSTMIMEALMRGVEFTTVPRNVKPLFEAIEGKDKVAIDSLIVELEEGIAKFANKDYNPNVDRRIAKVMLAAYAAEIPAERRPEIFNLIEKKYKGDYAKFVDEAFETSLYVNPDKFAKFAKKPKAKTLEGDLMYQFAKSVIDKYRSLSKESEDVMAQFATAKKSYIAGLLEMNEGAPTYPDANFTIRLTYGNVLSYSPADGVHYNYYTTLDGVMQKEDPNNWEFVVPTRLKELYDTQDYGDYANADGTMPCNFISNNDITGGNSGSPVINANGELIGAAFDGNWEAMSGDIVFEPAVQRTISVDIRYILFIIDKFAGATHLVEEMTIVK